MHPPAPPGLHSNLSRANLSRANLSRANLSIHLEASRHDRN
ncbi:pentapeptide repeat-containing protein [Planctomycetaceae bacterium SH139]